MISLDASSQNRQIYSSHHPLVTEYTLTSSHTKGQSTRLLVPTPPDVAILSPFLNRRLIVEEVLALYC